MKTLAFRLTRHTTTDPLKVVYDHNDIGVLPTWTCEGQSTYRATFAAPIGFVPKQVIPVLGDVFCYIVVEGNGANEFVVNFMVNDSLPIEAELTDQYIEVRVLDSVEQTAAAPIP